jgi:uncharacterized protein (DUF983 family)
MPQTGVLRPASSGVAHERSGGNDEGTRMDEERRVYLLLAVVNALIAVAAVFGVALVHPDGWAILAMVAVVSATIAVIATIRLVRTVLRARREPPTPPTSRRR